jgi:hypothetical protein
MSAISNADTTESGTLDQFEELAKMIAIDAVSEGDFVVEAPTPPQNVLNMTICGNCG